MKSYRLEVTTPEGCVFSGEALQISLRGADGDLAVMAGHIPLVTAVLPCECKIYDTEGDVRRAVLSGGLLCVSKEKTQLLTSGFEWKNEK